MRSISNFVSLLIVCLLPAFAAETPGELYQQGLRLFSEHQPDAAIAAFEQSLKLRPGDAATWKALGVVHASRSDYQRAEEPFHRACLLNPLLPDACLYFGRALYLLDRFEPALNVLRAALEKDAGNAQLHRIEALSLEALGRAAEADAAFQQAMRLDQHSPPNEDPAIDYGVFLYRTGRAQEALAALQAALQRHPDAARAYLESGCVLLELDRVTDAAGRLERAIALDPQSARAHLLLGKAYLRLGKTELARQQLDQGSRTVK
jgi:protein O-GlcNAc transferase